MLKKLVHAELRIIKMSGRSVQSKPAVVRVDKIGMHSLSFSSSLILPIMAQTVYKLQLTIINESIVLTGSLKRRRRKDDNHIYEMSYQLNEPARIKLAELLGELSRIYMPIHVKADYYYHYFMEANERYQTNRINLCI